MTRPSCKLVSALLAGALIAGGATFPNASFPQSFADPQPQAAATSSDTAASGQDDDGENDFAESKEKAKQAAAKAVKAREESKAGSKSSGETDSKADGKTAGKKGEDDEQEKAEEKAAKKKAAREKAAKQRQVVRAVAYLNMLETQLETATEDLSQIKKDRKKAQARTKRAKKAAAAARYDLLHAKRSLNTTVKEIYENGTLSFLSVLFGANDFEDFASRLYLLESIASKREDEVSRSRGLKETYETKLAQYQSDLAHERELEAEARERSKTITDSIDSQLELVAQLDPAMLSAVNDYDSVKATRKWLAKYGGSKSKKGSHPEIVNIASQYLGVPYVWGGETPAGFDCSGLVMYCYAKIGIDLPHFARSQYDCGKHIAADALMPGDLVFFGPDVEGIHHVGIYVGDGKYLQAPRTGDVVKVSSLADRNDYVGACRPGA